MSIQSIGKEHIQLIKYGPLVTIKKKKKTKPRTIKIKLHFQNLVCDKKHSIIIKLIKLLAYKTTLSKFSI